MVANTPTSVLLPLGVALVGLLAPLEPRASEPDLTLARDGGAFTIEAEVDIDAPSGAVQRVLSDPDFVQILNPRVRRVERLGTEGGAMRIRVASRRCVIAFCRDFSWVQRIRHEPSGDITVRFEPGSASVDGGEMHYDIDRLSLMRTRVRVRARIVPAVRLPPLIGPMIMRHTLAEDIRDWTGSIQRLAREDGRLQVAATPIASDRAEPFDWPRSSGGRASSGRAW